MCPRITQHTNAHRTHKNTIAHTHTHTHTRIHLNHTSSTFKHTHTHTLACAQTLQRCEGHYIIVFSLPPSTTLTSRQLLGVFGPSWLSGNKREKKNVSGEETILTTLSSMGNRVFDHFFFLTVLEKHGLKKRMIIFLHHYLKKHDILKCLLALCVYIVGNRWILFYFLWFFFFSFILFPGGGEAWNDM